MSYGYQPNQPRLGATFVPGGMDDYYMPSPTPDVVSPAPQRIMPEVPEQMQDSLSRLELEANAPGQNTTRQASITSYQSSNHARNYSQMSSDNTDLPNFSPFPKLQQRPPNVPQSDEEREAMLETARMPVLSSNDPEMQLAWAQDALTYVDTAVLHEERISQSQPARPVTPQVEHQLRVDAMNIASFLADQHHPKAEFMKGMWLEFGKFGLRQDKKEAFRCYSRAADKGYARANYRIGMQYEQSNDPVKALIHYNRGAEAGDSASNYRLGMMALLGQHGQQQDFSRGVHLLLQAADTADENAPQGAYVLGMLYARELPQVTVPESCLALDERAARTNIEKAAFLGFAKAQLKMGSAYELCSLGCDFNPSLSLHYNALAARQGEPEADMAISKWFLCGYEGVFQKNEELAYTYAQRAALTGLPTAEFAMGYFNEIGMYVPVNIDKALEWYEKAARSGNQDAADRIEGISKSRTLSKKDHENVAVNRIRSQYGSKRGARPERFKQQAPSLPTISDQTSTPPAHGAKSPPPRASTTTPYPLEDNAPSIAPPIDRPSTTTPYPMGDGPPMHAMGPRPGTAAPYLTPDSRASSAGPTERSSSAFGISPHVYGTPGAGRGVPAGQRLSAQPAGYPQRPFSAASDMSAGYRPPSSHRISPGPASPAYRPTSTSHPGSPPPGPIASPKLDIGFSAPPDERKSRIQNQNRPYPPSGHGPKPGSTKPPSSAPPQSQTFPPRKEAPSTHARPGKSESKPISSSKPNTASSKPSSGGTKPASSASKPPSAARPPGKGPKTFDEMGVPQTKADGECIVM